MLSGGVWVCRGDSSSRLECLSGRGRRRAGAVCVASEDPLRSGVDGTCMLFSWAGTAVSPATALTRPVLVSLQKAGWATLAPATAYSAWRSPRSTFGAWTTKAACSAARCQAPGCAGRSLKTPSSRWQSRPQVRLPGTPLLPRCGRPGLARPFP